jgi:hypothetical protein
LVRYKSEILGIELKLIKHTSVYPSFYLWLLFSDRSSNWCFCEFCVIRRIFDQLTVGCGNAIILCFLLFWIMRNIGVVRKFKSNVRWHHRNIRQQRNSKSYVQSTLTPPKGSTSLLNQRRGLWCHLTFDLNFLIYSKVRIITERMVGSPCAFSFILEA